MRLLRLSGVELEDFGFVMVEPDDGVIMGHEILLRPDRTTTGPAIL